MAYLASALSRHHLSAILGKQTLPMSVHNLFISIVDEIVLMVSLSEETEEIIYALNMPVVAYFAY